jgi:hypothetical protein
MSKVGKIIKKREQAKQKLEELNSKKISLEDALEFEPNLIKFLRKEYEGFLSVGKISSKPVVYAQDISCNEEFIEILCNGSEIGVYKRYIKNDGYIVSHLFRGSFFLSTHLGARRDERGDISFP